MSSIPDTGRWGENKNSRVSKSARGLQPMPGLPLSAGVNKIQEAKAGRTERFVHFTARNTLASGDIPSRGVGLTSLIAPLYPIAGEAPQSSLLAGETLRKKVPNPEGGSVNP